MSNSCLDEKKFKKKCPPPMDCCGKDILFRKVIIPVAMGDDRQYPPENGAFRNALVEYEANHALYIYSSDGLYTKLSVPSGVTSVNGMYGDVVLDIPEKVSQLINDLGFITKNADDLVNYTKTTNLAAVALSGSYNDLFDRPAINNGELTITRNGSALGSFKANQSQNVTMNVQVPTTTAELINNSQFVVDANYVHTDKNFTNALNNKLNHLADIYEIGDNLTLVNNRLNAVVPTPTPGDSYYDASWLFDEQTATQTHYDELLNAVTNNYIILIHQGTEHYVVSGALTQENDIQLMLQLSTTDSYDGNTYSNIITAFFDINGTTRDITISVGQTNGADIYEKFDNITYDASWVLTDGSTATQTHFDELRNAIQGKQRIVIIYPDGAIVTVVRQAIYSGDLFLNGQVSYINTYNNVNYVGITAAEITIASGSRQITILQGNLDGYSIQQQIDSKPDTSALPTKTSDLTNDSGFIDNTVNDLTNYYTKPTANTFGGIFMPDTTHMTPIKTIEYNTSSTAYYKIMSYANNSSNLADIKGSALFRVTVTGTNINQVFEVAISMKNAVNTNPYIMIRNYPGTTSASTTGIRYLRIFYPKAINNGGDWDIEFQTYNATARHFKVEVFRADPKFTFYETLTGSTLDTNTQNGGSTQIYTTDGVWFIGSNINGTISSATTAGSINSYLPKFVSGTLYKAGQAILAQQMVFLSTDNLFYPSTNTAKPIDPNVGIQLCSTATNANGTPASTAIRQKYNNGSLTNIPHATMVNGDRCYFRCTMDANGNILSDNYVDTQMTAGYTWYYIGTATSATAINHDTTQSMFYTLDANGKLTHINGLEIA